MLSLYAGLGKFIIFCKFTASQIFPVHTKHGGNPPGISNGFFCSTSGAFPNQATRTSRIYGNCIPKEDIGDIFRRRDMRYKEKENIGDIFRRGDKRYTERGEDIRDTQRGERETV